MIIIRDRYSNKVVGRVITNHSMTFDEIMDYAGFEYFESPNETGWTRDDGETIYWETDVIIEDD